MIDFFIDKDDKNVIEFAKYDSERKEEEERFSKEKDEYDFFKERIEKQIDVDVLSEVWPLEDGYTDVGNSEEDDSSEEDLTVDNETSLKDESEEKSKTHDSESETIQAHQKKDDKETTNTFAKLKRLLQKKDFEGNINFCSNYHL